MKKNKTNKPGHVMILEMCSQMGVNKNNTYEVCVMCRNCGAQYQASIKIGVLVKQHSCYNCGQQMLIKN